MAKINSDAYYYTSDATSGSWDNIITVSAPSQELQLRDDYWDYARNREFTNMEWLDRRIQEIRDCWKN